MFCSLFMLLCLEAFFVFCPPARFEPRHVLAPTKMGNAEPYHVEAQYDWNDDGTPDHFRLRVQKEVAPLVEGLEQTPARNQHWSYHCWLVVDSGFDQSTLWEDEWSVRESDLVSFQEIVSFGTADEFFPKWFTWKFHGELNQDLNLNSFEVRQLEDRIIHEDVLGSEIKRLKIEGITPAELKVEILGNESSRIFVYRGSQREDIRWAVYVPRLRKVMMFLNGFAD